MKLLFIIICLSVSGFSQTVEKKTGEVIYLTACGAEGDSVRFYRQTTAGSSPIQIGSVARTQSQVECKEIQYLMPSSTAAWYRFYAVPSKGTEALESTNGVRVKRIK